MKHNFHILNPQDKYEWYNKDAHTVVCPFNPKYEETMDRKILQLGQLGGAVIGEIDVPLRLVDARFLLYKLPHWIKIKEDDEDDEDVGIIDFCDLKDRHRMRICSNLIMMHTNVWTRYRAYHRFSCDSVISVVQDIEKVDYDADDTDAEGILWEKNYRDLTDPDAPARDWLDKNYPDWQHPMAYWT